MYCFRTHAETIPPPPPLPPNPAHSTSTVASFLSSCAFCGSACWYGLTEREMKDSQTAVCAVSWVYLQSLLGRTFAAAVQPRAESRQWIPNEPDTTNVELTEGDRETLAVTDVDKKQDSCAPVKGRDNLPNLKSWGQTDRGHVQSTSKNKR
ncbi:hypothetical protein FQN60_015407 [Etheostoma spectabile]|uniref:Uncharacterized protein n=1 Tax=Etheostoma spectabile TaxID=54343 RepID=A0A5J5CTV8_9PERO|nr:hypothetical protein FQN60_015407 [Etheostoma spectabile]